MTGKTHITLGVAGTVALLVLSNRSIESSTYILGASVLGSLVPDLDHPSAKLNQKILPVKNSFFKKVIYLIIGGILLYFDTKIRSRFLTLLGITIILTGLSRHRGFTHSILGLAMFSLTSYLGAVYYGIGNIYTGFIAGYAIHLIADFFTNSGIELFYPLSKKCKSPITVTTGGLGENLILLISILYLSGVVFNGLGLL